MHCHVVIPIRETSQVGEARRAAMRLGEGAGFNSNDAGRISIVVTELATNLVRHTSAGGELLLTSHGWGGELSVEISAIDGGPGMSDVQRCLKDGYSTAGTAGNGLGAVMRLSDESDLFSSEKGTVVWCRVIAGAPAEKRPRRRSEIGGVSIPAPGEIVCGDAWRAARREGAISLLVVDGLGHGPLAADAAGAAMAQFDKNAFDSPRAHIEAAHAAIAGTRGAAMAVARIDLEAGKLTYAGVGNISGTLLDAGQSRGLFSHNGIVGHQMRKVQEFEYPWQASSTLVMYSDGLQSRWSLDKYPGLAVRVPPVIAGVLYRDFKRGKDDVTVVAVAGRGGMQP